MDVIPIHQKWHGSQASSKNQIIKGLIVALPRYCQWHWRHRILNVLYVSQNVLQYYLTTYNDKIHKLDKFKTSYISNSTFSTCLESSPVVKVDTFSSVAVEQSVRMKRRSLFSGFRVKMFARHRSPKFRVPVAWHESRQNFFNHNRWVCKLYHQINRWYELIKIVLGLFFYHFCSFQAIHSKIFRIEFSGIQTRMVRVGWKHADY